MSNETSLTVIDQREVTFYGNELTAVLVDDEAGREVYVPVHTICDFMGVN